MGFHVYWRVGPKEAKKPPDFDGDLAPFPTT